MYNKNFLAGNMPHNVITNLDLLISMTTRHQSRELCVPGNYSVSNHQCMRLLIRLIIVAIQYIHNFCMKYYSTNYLYYTICAFYYRHCQNPHLVIALSRFSSSTMMHIRYIVPYSVIVWLTSAAHSCQCSSYKHVKEIQCPVTILDFYYEKMPDSEKTPCQYCNELGKCKFITVKWDKVKIF